mgnify:CR=1 FL=1
MLYKNTVIKIRIISLNDCRTFKSIRISSQWIIKIQETYKRIIVKMIIIVVCNIKPSMIIAIK